MAIAQACGVQGVVGLCVRAVCGLVWSARAEVARVGLFVL